jgi:hypothetical protein
LLSSCGADRRLFRISRDPFLFAVRPEIRTVHLNTDQSLKLGIE